MKQIAWLLIFAGLIIQPIYLVCYALNEHEEEQRSEYEQLFRQFSSQGEIVLEALTIGLSNARSPEAEAQKREALKMSLDRARINQLIMWRRFQQRQQRQSALLSSFAPKFVPLVLNPGYFIVAVGVMALFVSGREKKKPTNPHSQLRGPDAPLRG